MDEAERARQCDDSLAMAHGLLCSGCEGLFAATGLLLDPDYLVHALREAHLSAQVCGSIETACLDIKDAALLSQARQAVDAIGAGAVALRVALGHLSDLQSQKARAISAYTNNL